MYSSLSTLRITFCGSCSTEISLYLLSYYSLDVTLDGQLVWGRLSEEPIDVFNSRVFGEADLALFAIQYQPLCPSLSSHARTADTHLDLLRRVIQTWDVE